MKWLLTLLIGVLIYLTASPYITLYHIRSAADARDGESLAEYIEFPALRQNLKDQFSLAMGRNAAQQINDNPLGALAASFGGLITDRLVDSLVTPTALVGLVTRDERPDEERQTGAKRKGSSRLRGKDVDTGYTAWNKFEVSIPNEDGDQTLFKLRRTGLSWKVTNIVLPIDRFFNLN